MLPTKELADDGRRANSKGPQRLHGENILPIHGRKGSRRTRRGGAACAPIGKRRRSSGSISPTAYRRKNEPLTSGGIVSDRTQPQRVRLLLLRRRS